MTTKTKSEEYPVTIAGLDGRMFMGSNEYPQRRGPVQKILLRKESAGRYFNVKLQFDDTCGNGHCTFSITGEKGRIGARDSDEAGCIHDEINKAFPQLAKYIKWHLTSTDGPMHYLANAVYLAGDRDCHGKRKGEPWSWEYGVQFGDNPIWHKLGKRFSDFLVANQAATNANGPKFDFEVLRIDHENRRGETYKLGPKFTFGGFADKWHECPFDDEQTALDFLKALQECTPLFVKRATQWSDGKERELDSARNVAVWPNATDEQLMSEPDVLKGLLEARLPQLMEDFKRDMLELGFDWEWPAGVRS